MRTLPLQRRYLIIIFLIETKSDDINETSSGPKLADESEVNAFRNRLQIKVNGSDVPAPSARFSSMNISSKLKHIILKNIEESKWKEPTPIQMQAIPCLLHGKNVLAAAPTGSGKVNDQSMTP